MEVHIEGFDNANGVLLLSRKGAAVQADWASVAVGMIVEARVTETNKGGLAVEINGIRGFMPISQIDLYRVEDAAQFVNQKLLCMVTEVDPSERNLVVSRRALLEKEREENREKLWAELDEGQVREGIVRSVRDFGAFVDLGGVDGLIHVSEMSWQRVKDPSEVVQPGQTVKVVVLKLDREHRKVSLGLKQLTASPWDDVTEKYHTGQVVDGQGDAPDGLRRLRGVGAGRRGIDPHFGAGAAARAPRHRRGEGGPGRAGDGAERGPGAAAHLAVAEGGLAQGAGTRGGRGAGRGRGAGWRRRGRAPRRCAAELVKNNSPQRHKEHKERQRSS